MNFRKLLRTLTTLLLLSSLCLILPAAAYAEDALQLTDAQKRFIEEHPVIRLGVDPGFIPYEFFDTDGEYKGIAADYLRLIGEKTGLQFDVARDLTWSEAYENAVERKLDALPCISKTAQRERYFLFSDPYISFQRVMFINKDNREINMFEDLAGRTVAVQRNSSHHSYLSDFHDIALNLYATVEDALRAVADGTETAFVGNLATSNYLAKANGIANLKYLPIRAQDPQSLYFAVRSDWPELVGIVNKALAAIDEESRIEISDRWISVEQSADYTWLLRMVLIGLGVIALIVLVSSFWIVRLRKEIIIRKQSEQELEKARQEADEANRFKSRFLARMSHEIRTPLNGIIGMSYLLKKTDVSLTQKMYVDRITQSSSIMLGIINDILDFSKIEAGKVELEIAPFSMDQVTQDVVSIVSFKIEEQKIGFRLIKDPMVPNWFLGDSKRIEQILINILNNAAKFTSEGEVSLDIRLAAREGDTCRIAFTVKDSGIGMTEEQVDRLFTPFQQGDTSINRRFGGTGLGLSIVKNLVDLMNGTIQVQSVPGEGSTFIIQIPLPVETQKETEFQQRVSGDQLKDIRTLVLEKTGSSMNLIRSYLDSFGMYCELTTSQLSAMSMLQAANGRYAKPFDLLILDYDTPTEGGFRFVENILHNPHITQKPKILMLLPMMRDDLFDQLDENHVDIGVGKPIIQSVLLNGILDIFHLQAIAASQVSPHQADDSAVLGDGYTVLLAEDNKTNQLIAKTLLEQTGVTVLLAENGKLALDMFVQHQSEIDLILMDLHMPVMNGYEASEQIRKLSQEVPIIAMTADVVTGVKDKCEMYGIHHYLTKPFDPDHFVRKMKEMLKERQRVAAKPPAPEASAETPAASQDAAEPPDTETAVAQAASQLQEEIGMKNMGMNRALYRQVLTLYREENLDTAQLLAAAIEDKQYAEAIGIVHKLKSSSGSIGAKPLYELAVRLQKVLKEETPNEINQLSGELSDMLIALLDEIQTLLESEA